MIKNYMAISTELVGHEPKVIRMKELQTLITTEQHVPIAGNFI